MKKSFGLRAAHSRQFLDRKPMAKRKRYSHATGNENPGKGASGHRSHDVRIVGGTYRGRKLLYESYRVENDPITRPMKHRVREAIFNLIGLEVQGCYAIDLFAGTGALGLEAISRGAIGATFIEKHVPTARVVETNIVNLGVESITELKTTSAFLWARRDLASAEGAKTEDGRRKADLDRPSGLPHTSGPQQPSGPIPWLVFCSPPYAFYVTHHNDMLELITTVAGQAPIGSLVVVEADERFDFNQLPGGPVGEKRTDRWQVRTYPPAVVGVWRKRI
jgi:16S rRNA (guanine966-N2)-methyltransferase